MGRVSFDFLVVNRNTACYDPPGVSMNAMRVNSVVCGPTNTHEAVAGPFGATDISCSTGTCVYHGIRSQAV